MAQTGYETLARTAFGDLEALQALPDLLRNTVHAYSYPDQKWRRQICAVHRLFAPIRLFEQLYRSKLTVFENVDGTKVYNHELSGIEKPGATRLREGLAEAESVAGRPPSSTRNVVDLLRSIKVEQCRDVLGEPLAAGHRKATQG